jgi:ATP adenylyltransferase
VPLGSATDLEVYRELASSCGVLAHGGADARTTPHNLLMTRDWMLIVPRSSGAWGTIDVNALGFAGALAVRTESDLEALRETGPLEVLTRVGARSQRRGA